MRSGGGDRLTLENGREIKSPWKKWKNLKWPQEDRKTQQLEHKSLAKEVGGLLAEGIKLSKS